MKRKIKFISGLLALFMLALVFVPCSDHCDEQEHTITLGMEQAKEHHEEHQDLCSPFCYCTCCSTSITIKHFSDLQIHLKLFSNQVVPFNHSLIAEIPYSIWQPPKIS